MTNKKNQLTSLTRIFIIALLLTSASIINSCGGGSKSIKTITAEEQFTQAKQLYDKGKYFESAEEFQKVVYNYPGSRLVDTAQFFLANSYLEDGQYELAAVEFERLIKNYPRSKFGPDSRYLTGYAKYLASPSHYGLDQADLVLAIRIMNDFIIDYPESKMIPEAEKSLLEASSRLAKKLYKSGMVYVHSRAFPSAIIYFKKVIEDYPKTEYAPLALMEIAKSQSNMNSLEESAASFNSFIAQYPEHLLLKKANEGLKKVEEKLSKVVAEATESETTDATDTTDTTVTTDSVAESSSSETTPTIESETTEPETTESE